MIQTDPGAMGIASAMTKASQLSEARDEPRKKAEEGQSVLSNIADGIDAVDLAANVCGAAAKAMTPSYTTGGKELPQVFLKGGGDGTAGGFQTGADCLPAVETASSAAESGAGLLVDIGAGVADAVGTVIGGIFSVLE
jgi:hypothetical protein